MDKTITLEELFIVKCNMQEEAESWKAEASEDYYEGFMEAVQLLETFIRKEYRN